MPPGDIVDLYESHTGTSAAVEQPPSPSRRDTRVPVAPQKLSASDQPKRDRPPNMHPLLRPALPVVYPQAADAAPIEGLPKLTSSTKSTPIDYDTTASFSTPAPEFDITTATTFTTLHDDGPTPHHVYSHRVPADNSEGLSPPTVRDIDFAKGAIQAQSGMISSQNHKKAGLFIDDSILEGDDRSMEGQNHSFQLQSASATPLLHASASHQPVSASVVFARGAAPLFFPELDRRLAGIAAPVFPTFTKYNHAGRSKLSTMFPPMQLLASSGRSLEDLEHNSQKTQWWKDRGKIFGFLVSLVLSVTV